MNEKIKKILSYIDWAGLVISWAGRSLRSFPVMAKIESDGAGQRDGLRTNPDGNK
jgi:hypothetical protein